MYFSCAHSTKRQGNAATRSAESGASGGGDDGAARGRVAIGAAADSG